MQVLLALTGSYFLAFEYTLGVSKDASTRVVHGISNGIIGKRPCIIPNLGCGGVSTMLLAHIKYRITHMPTLYAAIPNELIFFL